MVAIVNALRDNLVLTPQQTAKRASVKKCLQSLKTTLIVAAVSSIFFFSIFPSVFTLVTASAICFCATEIHKVSLNILKILENAATEANVRISKERLFEQLAKNTFAVSTLLDSFNPPLTLDLILKTIK